MLGSTTPQTRRAAGDSLLLTLQQVIGSSTHVVAQHALSQLLPPTVLFWRSLFAATAALLWLLRHRHLQRLFHLAPPSDMLQLLLLGALAVPLNQWCFFAGVRLTTAANASLLYALTPVWALLLSWLLHQERITRPKVLGILLSFTGVLFVLAEKEFAFGPHHTLGNLLLLCASLAWASFTVLSRRLALRYGALPTTAVSMLTGWLLYLPIWFLLGAPLQFAQLTPILWAELLYMGIVTSGIGYFLWLVPLRHMEPSRVAIFSTLQPVFTTVVTIPLFGFAPTPAFLLGGLLIIAGVILTQYR